MNDCVSWTAEAKRILARTSRPGAGMVAAMAAGRLNGHSPAGNPAPAFAELAFFDHLPVGLAIYDRDGALAHGNAHFARLVSCPQLPSRGARRWQGWAGDGRALAFREFPCERALQGEIVSPGVDLLHFGEGGDRRWLNVSAAPICDPVDHAVLGVVLLFLDLHGQPEAANFAARATRRFRQFAEHSSAAIWIADAASRAFSYRNPGHLRLLDPADGAVACLADWFEHIEAADRALVAEHYERVLAGGTAHHEYRLNGGGGARPRHLRETSFAIRDEAGAIIMIGGITEEIAPAIDQRIYLIGGAGGSPASRDALRGLGRLDVKSFGSIADFLEVAGYLVFGCVVVDLNAVAEDGQGLARLLADHGPTLPVLIVGRPETPAAKAVAAMRAGAADYLLPPLGADEIAAAVRHATARFQPRPAEPAPERPIALAGDGRLATLSRRELDVLTGLRAGGTNKSIGRDLGISPRTVEAHRSRLMERMNARNLAELLQAVQ